MTIDTNAIIKLIVDVMGEHQIQVTVRQAGKGAMFTGVCSFAGAMIAGPVGLAVGGAAGGLIAAYTTKGTFKPIGQILEELPFERKRQIAIEIQSVLNKLEITDLAEFAKLVAICNCLAQPQHILVQKLIEESLPIIQRQILMN